MAKKKRSATCLLKLTERQRESVLRCTNLARALARKLRNAGEGTQVVEVTREEFDQLEGEVSYAASYVRHPHKGRLDAVLRKIENLICEADEALVRQVAPGVGTRPANEGDLRYQFKITLREIRPPVWRRIQIADGTLADLHDYIQSAFGWEDYHLHQFEISGQYYGPPSDEFSLDDEMFDETEVRISDLVPASGRTTRWLYEYDFGDGWRHEVLFEGFVPADPEVEYPICVGGKRACPPEDCGGPWGYAELVEAISDPTHQQHEELLNWRGPFDPEAFDAQEATKTMRRGR